MRCSIARTRRPTDCPTKPPIANRWRRCCACRATSSTPPSPPPPSRWRASSTACWRPDDAGDAGARDGAVNEGDLDAEVRRRFEAFRNGPRYAAARAETRAAIERLLATAVQRRTGNAGLVRLVDLLDTVCRRPAYVALLGKYPEAFGRVLGILDWAKWPADYLMQHPVVLDELLDGQLLDQTDYLAWSRQLRERVDAARHDGQPDVERQMDIVREAHHAQVFRLMAQDLAGRLTVERVSDHLSELADRVLDLAIELVWATAAAALSRPAAVRRDRLRSAGRQGTRLHLGPRPGVPVRRRRRARARGLRAAGAAPVGLAVVAHCGRAAVRDRPAPAAERRRRPAGVEAAAPSKPTSANRPGCGSTRR